MARRGQRSGFRAPGGDDRRRHREEQRRRQGARAAELPHRAGRQRPPARAPVRHTVRPRPPATRPRHEPSHQGRRLGREAPAPRRARDGSPRGPRFARADRRGGRHDAAAGRQSSPIRRAGAAHRHRQLGTRHPPRGAGGAPASGARRHPGGHCVTRRRKPQPKPQGKAKRKPAPKAPAPVPQAAGVDPLADARIRPFVERYCDLAGVKLLEKGSDLRELKLPPAERAHFQGRESVRLALSLDALERSPDAEIAVLGSPFLTHLIEAIRTRAGRLSLGMIPPPPPVTADDEDVAPSVAPPVPVRDGEARQSSVGLAAHPIGRLVARVVLRAGAGVEEAVVESEVFDLSTGTRSSDDVAGLFQDLEARRVKAAAAGVMPDATPVLPREPDEMLKLLLANLREKSAERVAARQTVAEKEVATELDRLDRYFASILADKSDSEEERTITAL